MKREGWCCCSKGGLKLFTLHHPWPASPISPTRSDDLWTSPLSIFSFDMLAADLFLSPTLKQALLSTQLSLSLSLSLAFAQSIATISLSLSLSLSLCKCFYLLRSTSRERRRKHMGLWRGNLKWH
uniref:Uncharacterized protein n=1 Tax=Arundo donax TaxID=35708 RepID=A0A0A9CSG9_ARUDO